MTTFHPPRLLVALLMTSLLAGCAEMAPLFERNLERNHPRVSSRSATQDEARPRTDARTDAPSAREQAALRDGIRLYHDGDFDGAIKRLGSNDIRANAPARVRVTALKYQAFSYCVTSRPKQCEQAFERALKIDPSFTLEAGEQGHPLWGPAFERAKRG